jgi:phosphate starvation-inducible membrane PsiE
MLKIWGWLGLILIVLLELNFIFKIQPFALWYFPIIWFGYILFIDSLVYKIKGKSLISNNLYKLLGMFIISPLVWWIFEFFNLALQNWHYTGVEDLGVFYNLFAFLAFSTVMPAFFETFDFVKAVFKFEERHKKKKIKNSILYILIFLGLICLILPLILPKYFFPLIWISLFLILDPVNYLRRQPSLLSQFKNKNYKIFGFLSISILIMAFFWEFWNYYAVIKWVYTMPFFNFFKIFEMPFLGYLGYIPFSFELYSIYYFIKSLF